MLVIAAASTAGRESKVVNAQFGKEKRETEPHHFHLVFWQAESTLCYDEVRLLCPRSRLPFY